jgi:hypothetical protein
MYVHVDNTSEARRPTEHASCSWLSHKWAAKPGRASTSSNTKEYTTHQLQRPLQAPHTAGPAGPRKAPRKTRYKVQNFCKRPAMLPMPSMGSTVFQFFLCPCQTVAVLLSMQRQLALCKPLYGYRVDSRNTLCRHVPALYCLFPFTGCTAGKTSSCSPATRDIQPAKNPSQCNTAQQTCLPSEALKMGTGHRPQQ